MEAITYESPEAPEESWRERLLRGPGTRGPGGALKPAFVWLRPEDDVPALYSTEQDAEPLAKVKLFTPDGSWTWYIVESDGDGCFGLVDGHEVELGYFSLHELATVRGPMGLCIERDLYWTPRPWREIQAERVR